MPQALRIRGENFPLWHVARRVHGHRPGKGEQLPDVFLVDDFNDTSLGGTSPHTPQRVRSANGVRYRLHEPPQDGAQDPANRPQPSCQLRTARSTGYVDAPGKRYLL